MFMLINKIRKAKDYKKAQVQDTKKVNCLETKYANLTTMETWNLLRKKIRLEKAASKYKSMDVVKKTSTAKICRKIQVNGSYDKDRST